MLVLFETSAGYAVFRIKNEKKLEEVSDFFKEFQDPESACNFIQLEQFVKFADTKEALAAAADIIEGKISKKLSKLLKKLYVTGLNKDILAVADKKLSGEINSKFSISVNHDSKVQQLMRGIRSQLPALLPGITESDMSRMTLGLAHSLNRYKLKCNPDKIDTMIVQAIALLDDLDKEANNFIMRCKEMYGWHFPELSKVVSDNLAYIKVVNKIGVRENCTTMDLTDILPEEIIEEVKQASIISLGTEITDEDVEMVRSLCDQVLEISESRIKLYEYLKNRMLAVAPNLTALVGELLGARLISHAGSLISLAKHPSSTVQILGAEKALFRALKTRNHTPKYGLLYHAGLVTQATPKIKGKISRMLAAKASLAIRADALGEDIDPEMGLVFRERLEKRLKDLEAGKTSYISGVKGRFSQGQKKFASKETFESSGIYDAGSDMPMGESTEKSKDKQKKRKFKQEVKTEEDEADNAGEEVSSPQEEVPSSPKKKKIKLEVKQEEVKPVVQPDETSSTKKKKKKKKKSKAAAVEQKVEAGDDDDDDDDE